MRYLHLESHQESFALLHQKGIQGLIVSGPLETVKTARRAGLEIRWTVPDLWRLGRLAANSRSLLLRELAFGSEFKSWFHVGIHILTSATSSIRKNFALPLEVLGRLQTLARRGEWVYLDAHATDILVGFGNLSGLRHCVNTFRSWGFHAGLGTANLRTLAPALLDEGWLPDGILASVDPYCPTDRTHEDLEWGKILGVEIVWDLSRVHESWALYGQWASLPRIVAPLEHEAASR